MEHVLVLHIWAKHAACGHKVDLLMHTCSSVKYSCLNIQTITEVSSNLQSNLSYISKYKNIMELKKKKKKKKTLFAIALLHILSHSETA